MFNPEVMGSKPSQSLNSVGNQDLDLCRSNSAQCDASLGVGFRSRVLKGMLQCVTCPNSPISSEKSSATRG